MPRKFKFVLIGVLVLLILVGVLSLGTETTDEPGIVPTEITPKETNAPLEPTVIEMPKEKDARPK